MRRPSRSSPLPGPLVVAFPLLVAVSCGGSDIVVSEPPPEPAPAPGSAPLVAPPVAAPTAPVPEDSGEGAAMCPEGMAYVDTTYCPEVELDCAKSEYNAPNRITICHRFAGEQRCKGSERRQRFCIDRYEYPNQKGAHPPVMVDWYDANGMCREQGKRLCWQSEWEAACEGPDKLPFPYGKERSAEKCNIDNPWRGPGLKQVYSSDPEIAGAELRRLDQSVPSGAKEGCVSGFGVHDLTGNFDEWVNAEKPKGEAKWAGLKGGAWGHVRNACRPMTTSHSPEFTYYFISFRCCADPLAEAPIPAEGPPLYVPPPAPDHPDPTGAIQRGWPPSPSP